MHLFCNNENVKLKKSVQNLRTYHEHTQYVRGKTQFYFGYCTKSWKYIANSVVQVLNPSLFMIMLLSLPAMVTAN